MLSDGTTFKGTSFGANKSMPGEVVFNTGMVGYPEALTDPSYRGQILVLTYPLVGNYGVPSFDKIDAFGLPTYFESKDVQIAGLVVSSYSEDPSHWASTRSLGSWLEEAGVPAIFGVDTRMLTKSLRERGAMLGRLEVGSDKPTGDFVDPNLRHLVAEVSTKTIVTYGVAGGPKIVAIDCGMKFNIIRYLVEAHGVELTVVPHDYDLETNPAKLEWDGVFCSNGPGDPSKCAATIKSLKWAISQEKPVFGICLGNQILALAAGGATYKMKYGNRGMNQPCVDLRTTRCYITSQNHGFAVDDSTLPDGWRALFINANDRSNEGITHTSKPFFSVQFHPEAAGGPFDTAFLFESFVRLVRGNAPQLTLLDPNIYRHDRASLKRVLLVGSGGLSIGQAGEFDYSGSQAIKALREEGIEVVLINPNIATVQTSREDDSNGQLANVNQAAQSKVANVACADRVYLLPVTAANVRMILDKESDIDGIIVSMGGQTALNVGIELWANEDLQKRGIRVLGTNIDAIISTEDREIFSGKLREINETLALSYPACTVDEALEAAHKIGYPVLVRAAFTLGGLGSGFAENDAELIDLAKNALEGATSTTKQILIDQDLRGWKEVEYEVVRDVRDNCITVCNMENFDPLGVHTGDSIVVAPSQTLSNEEYHMLRSAALRVVRHLGIIGECNIQYALHPTSLEYCIIEVNPRLSRSSALASKATGYPLAFVAAKLAMGVTLPELRNSVTGGATIMGFEPALDYCVTKFPRWDLSKFAGAQRVLGSAMASVGEVMAIGRTFEESFQKALRMVDPANPGFEPVAPLDTADAELEEKLVVPTDRRVWSIAEAMYRNADGWDKDRVRELTKIDDWFLSRLEKIAAVGRDGDFWAALKTDLAAGAGADSLRRAKQLGFTDDQIAKQLGTSDDAVRAARKALGVTPVVKQIDTLAAEYAAQTNYLYTTYHGDDDDVASGADGLGGTMVLGSGPYRIGSSVEFDWCAVSAMRALRESGQRGIMINCNPETVSTDYDECDALYFEELSKERVMDIYDMEQVDNGVVISMGGQIPQNLAVPVHEAGGVILGTHPDMIDAAEDRSKFSALMDAAGVDQPKWAELESHESAVAFADDVGYPVLVRPSFVLSGAAMKVCRDEASLRAHLDVAKEVSRDFPVVVSQFVRGARELEMDGVAKDGVVVCAQAHEHVEDAGVHSGDATLLLPPQSLSDYTLNRARDATAEVVKQLNISGPFNIQFLVGGRARGADSRPEDELDGSFPSMNDVRIIECNLRASRSVPFVSKATGVDFADVATRVLAGLPLPDASKLPQLYPTAGAAPENFVAVKAPMFSFSRLRGADPALGVEMSSTGEVACFGKDKEEAFLKALLATTMKLPTAGDGEKVLVSFAKPLAHRALAPAYQLSSLGYELVGTAATAAYLSGRGVPCAEVAFPTDAGDAPGGPDDAVALIRDGKIKLAVNLHAPESTRLADNYLIRRAAADFNIALVTNAQVFEMIAASLTKHAKGEILAANPTDLFSYYENEAATDAWTQKDEFH